MQMIEVKAAELIGPALDWAVAQVNGVEDIPGLASTGLSFEPSTNWAQGGLLIEKHQIDLCWDGADGKAMWWHAYHQDIADQQTHQSPLIALCRAIVAAKLGDVVSVPAELVSQ